MDEELEALRRENAALKKELEQQTMNAANLAREAFLADLVGSNRLSPEEFHVDLPSDRFALMAIVIRIRCVPKLRHRSDHRSPFLSAWV